MAMIANQAAYGRLPCGRRGLKRRRTFFMGHVYRRLPCGRRGLKLFPDIADNDDVVASRAGGVD